MGTNYYARILPTLEEKENLKKLIDSDDFYAIEKEVQRLYGESTEYDKGAEVHLGKRSGGWKFLFNPNYERYYKLTKEGLKEFLNNQKELVTIIKRINKTNNTTLYNEEWTLSDALVERDILLDKRSVLASSVERASFRLDRYSKTEIKYVSTINVKEIQKEVDKLSKQYRELDTKIQGLNWSTDLI